MSKKFKSQASSARAASGVPPAFSSGFGSSQPAFQFQTSSSSLSYIAEQPDLNGVTDPNIVVSLRNLGKKDSTTKLKALEELQEHVSASSSTVAVEEAVVAAWIALYPRTAVDNSRRVRQLAHSLQGSLTSRTTKRIVPYLPKAVGSWLSGLYDNDKAVARSAQDALTLAFPTSEKRATLWKVYSTALLDYAEDAILLQTAGTLSDERSTSKDDADAKYSRVVGSAILMLAELIKTNVNEPKSQTDFAPKLHNITSNKKLWEFAYSPDPYLRKACYTLVLLTAQHVESMLDWDTISSCFVAKGLTADQLGSTGSYVEALLRLTQTRPTIWTIDYHAKTAGVKKLLQFLAKGSRRGPEKFWRDVTSLIKTVPRQAISTTGGHLTLEDVTAFATALRQGLASQEEPRQNLTAARSSYVDICFWLQEQMGSKKVRESFLEAHPLPLVAMYANPSSSTTTLPAASGLQLAASILVKLAESGFTSVFADIWDRLIRSLIEMMKLSLPETSKDFVSSQDAVVAQSNRLHKLQQAILQATPQQSHSAMAQCFEDSGTNLMSQSIELLKNRNGKPYGAAAVLQDVTKDSKPSAPITEFLEENMTSLLESPSAERLVALWKASDLEISPLMKELLSRQKLDHYGEKALSRMLASAPLKDVEDLSLVKELTSQSPDARIKPEQHSMISSLLENPAVASSDWKHALVSSMSKDLRIDTPLDRQNSMLTLIDSLTSNVEARAALIGGESGNELHARIMLLADSVNQSTSEKASAISWKLQSSSIRGAVEGTRVKNLIGDQLAGAQPQLSILALVDLALTEVQNATDKTEVVEKLLPSSKAWESAVGPHTVCEVPQALSITSPLKGIVSAIESNSQTVEQVRQPVRDSEGFSQLFRLALYTSRLLSDTHLLAKLDSDTKQTLVQHLPLVLQYVNEKLTLESANDIWLGTSSEVLDEAADVLSTGNSVVQQLISDEVTSMSWLMRLAELPDNTSASYHEALASIDIVCRTIDRDGPGDVLASWEAEIKLLHKSPPLIRSAAIISCLRQSLATSGQGKRLVNELVSDATDLKTLELSVSSLRPLVLLNILLAEGTESLEGVQSQRLVFLMQNLVRLLDSDTEGLPMVSEILKLLAALMSSIQDIYGEHWQQILDFLGKTWDQDLNLEDDLPILHASLRLYLRLKVLATTDDANEDLADAWRGTRTQLEEGLLQCLHLFEQPSSGVNQPRQISASLLGRLIATVEVKHVGPLYRLMSSQDDAILEATYGLLHRAIPRQQEDLSLDLALEKQIIKLPPELLELLVDTPDPTESTALTKRYLLCWQLAFDHFENASYKLREAYLASLKEENNLPTLLYRVCDIIKITDSRAIDASKFTIDNFNPGSSESDTRELQWLAIHIYYRSLLFTPNLAKAWFIEQKNRIRTPLESWTQKHISSYIVTASFDTVTAWANAQDQDDNPLTIKSSPKSYELTASLPIDAESPPIVIAITLPPSYPLSSPSVISRTRVAVSEKNWTSWLRTFQIIIFSTGSIIEGLIAFRRNVQGAIKGQGECAICYSVIGTDMQTPNKKCGTCGNAFHGGCLYRWFKSSNSSSCPLCRNNFNYA